MVDREQPLRASGRDRGSSLLASMSDRPWGWRAWASASALALLRILRRVQGASALILLLDEKSTRAAQLGRVWFLASVMPCAKVKSTADVDCDPK